MREKDIGTSTTFELWKHMHLRPNRLTNARRRRHVSSAAAAGSWQPRRSASKGEPRGQYSASELGWHPTVFQEQTFGRVLGCWMTPPTAAYGSPHPTCDDSPRLDADAPDRQDVVVTQVCQQRSLLQRAGQHRVLANCSCPPQR